MTLATTTTSLGTWTPTVRWRAVATHHGKGITLGRQNLQLLNISWGLGRPGRHVEKVAGDHQNLREESEDRYIIFIEYTSQNNRETSSSPDAGGRGWRDCEVYERVRELRKVGLEW